MSVKYDRLALCHNGEFLALDEIACASIWPRDIYPSADDAIAAAISLDVADDDLVHVRLVWAIEHNTWSGYWSWFPVQPDDASVECWEIE